MVNPSGNGNGGYTARPPGSWYDDEAALELFRKRISPDSCCLLLTDTLVLGPEALEARLGTDRQSAALPASRLCRTRTPFRLHIFRHNGTVTHIAVSSH